MKTNNNGRSLPAGKKDQPKPWRDSTGKVLCDTELIRISREWDQETWTRFLDDTVDVPQREQVFGKKEKEDDIDYETLLNEQRDKQALEDYLAEPEEQRRDPEAKLKARIGELARELPPKESVVINYFFYHDLSIRRSLKKWSCPEAKFNA